MSLQIFSYGAVRIHGGPPRKEYPRERHATGPYVMVCFNCCWTLQGSRCLPLTHSGVGDGVWFVNKECLMSVSSVASSSSAYVSALQQQASATAVQRSTPETENDGDKDDGAATVKAPAPSVNLNGQTVGKSINVTAWVIPTYGPSTQSWAAGSYVFHLPDIYAASPSTSWKTFFLLPRSPPRSELGICQPVISTRGSSMPIHILGNTVAPYGACLR